MRRVYLDHNATTPTAPQVRAALSFAFDHLTGNPSSVHREGQRARAALEEARRRVAQLIGADTTEITFTSGATEANNIALGTLANTGGALITSCVEHPSILAPLERLQNTVWRLPVDHQGMLPPTDTLFEEAEALGATALSVMLANNETGVLYPLAELTRAAHARGMIVHCDATQALGKIPVSVTDLGVDMLPTLHNLTSRLAKMYYQTSNEEYKNMDIETLIFINNSEKYARLLENVTHPAN